MRPITVEEFIDKLEGVIEELKELDPDTEVIGNIVDGEFFSVENMQIGITHLKNKVYFTFTTE